LNKVCIFGLTGYPIDESYSPLLYRAALKYYDIKGEYNLYPVRPLSDGLVELSRLLNAIRRGDIKGLNVTTPYKHTVIPFLDVLTPIARDAQAVNTIIFRDGFLVGDNTDAPGFLADLNRILDINPNKGETSRQALILGAGGAAYSIVYALLGAGWKVTVAARNIDKVHKLAANLLLQGYMGVKAVLLTTSLLEGCLDIGLVVNATTLGMSSSDLSLSPWPEGLPLPQSALIYDLIYRPRETTFLRLARSNNLPAYNGIGMLVEQAALSFERWTGLNNHRNIMWQAIRGKE
jgi:shikimate dehydrogenase